MDKINPEELIAAVEKRPVLWQCNHKKYKHKSITNKEWDQVGAVCNCSGQTAKYKWKNLKDTFRRIHKNVTRAAAKKEVFNVKWPYYVPISFVKMAGNKNVLEPKDESQESDYCTVTRREIYNRIGVKRKIEIESEAELIDIADDDDDEDEEETEKVKDEMLEEPIIYKQLREMNDESNDDDMQFFRSLLPMMKNFNDIQKLEIRGEVQKIILSKLKKIRRF